MALLKKLIDAGDLEHERYKDVLFHRISTDEELKPLGVSSKVNTEWAFLEHLHDVGYRTTSVWLEENYRNLGKRSTIDIGSVYLKS